MLRSLFTGISGLKAHQQMLDVTANNVANVNTTGYKSSSTVFQDTLSQTLTGAGAPVAGPPATGGTNALQVGLGVQLAATTMNFTQGGNQATGVTSNMMINGDGFFVIQKNGSTLFTRAGAFTVDAAGQLVTPDGALAMNWDSAATPPAISGPVDLSPLLDPANNYVSWSIDASGTINAVKDDGTIDVLGQVALAGFANPNGLMKVGNTAYAASANSGLPDIGAAKSGSRGSISAGYVEMSNVDLAAELTNLIISERGFQANSKVITTSDEVLQTLVNLK